MSAAISLFLLGLSFGAGPCLASCGPLTLSYFAASGKSYLESLAGYLVFSLARILVYILLSLLIFFFGKITAEQFLAGASQYVNIIGGFFIAALGLTLLLRPYRRWGLCNFLEKHLLARGKKSLFILGLIVALLPCAPLLAMLAYVAVISRQWVSNLLYGLTFGLGTALSPLLLFSFFAGGFSSYLEERRHRIFLGINVICGILMIFLGLHLIFKVRG